MRILVKPRRPLGSVTYPGKPDASHAWAYLPDLAATIALLLDRAADIYLAQRSGAEGWLIKPLDALRLKRAALAVMNGELYQEGVPRPMPVTLDGPTEPEVAGTPEEEPAPAG